MFFFEEEDYPEIKDFDDEKLINLINIIFSDKQKTKRNSLEERIYKKQKEIIEEYWQKRRITAIELERNRFKKLLVKYSKEVLLLRYKRKRKIREKIKRRVKENAKRTIVRKNFKFEIFQNYDRRG